MQKKNTIAMVLAAAMLLPTNAFAASPSDFSDFPSDWSTAALTSAVENGLLNGSDGLINASGALTRAEMAAIVNRAFGATATASLSGYSDVPQSAWYYTDMAKAVQMGTFEGSDGRLNPNDPITREEAFVVLARAFALEEGSTSALDRFSDSSAVSSWARGGVAALVENGYIEGAGGMLHPQDSITRAEFAQVMANLVGTYVTSAETVTAVADGNVIVRTDGASLQDMTINGDLIIADSADSVSLSGVTVAGKIIIRGGLEQVTVTGSSASGGVVVANPNGTTDLSSSDSTLGTVTVNSDLTVSGDFDEIIVAENADVTVQSGAVSRITVSDAAASSAVTVASGASVSTVQADATGVSVRGEGTVTNVQANADDVSVSTAGTRVTAASGTTGVTAAGTAVEAGQTATINSAGTGATISGSATTGGGSSGGGSSGGGTSDEDDEAIEVASWQELKDAIQTAEAGATIRLTADITDAGSAVSTVDGVSSATLPMEGAEGSKYFTLDGDGHTISAAANSTFCFLINTGGEGTTTVRDLTVDGGSNGSKVGGAFFLENGNIVFDNVTFIGCGATTNAATNGGGALCLNNHGGMPSVTVRNCTFENCYVGVEGAVGQNGRGGAIYANHFNTSPVTDETAVMSLTVENSTFRGNKAAYGGAIAADGNVDLTVTGCTFKGNESAVGGDDIYIFEGVSAGKKSMSIYSDVNAVLSGNDYTNDTDSGSDMTAMNVIYGRYYPADYTGSTTHAAPDGAADLTFADVERTMRITEAGVEMRRLEVAGNTYYGGYNLPEGQQFAVNGEPVSPEEIAAGSGVYIYEPAGNVEDAAAYGTAALSYEEFYAAEDVTAADEGYDAISSATTGKSTMFTNADSSEVTDTGYTISGVKNTPVQVDADQYAKAWFLNAAGALSDQAAGYVNAAEITLNEDAAAVPAWYKTLNADGTYGAIAGITPTQVTDATATLSTSSRWGDYLVAVTDPEGTKNLRNDRNTGWPIGENIMGIIVEATKGDQTIKVGMRHLENIWVQTYEFAFDAEGVTADLVGATINKITYIVPGNVYEYTFADGIYVKPAYTSAVIGAFAEGYASFTLSTVPTGLENAKLTVTYTVGSGRNAHSYTLYSGALAEMVELNLDAMKDAEEGGTYSATITSDNYADITVQLPMSETQRETLESLIEQGEALVEKNSSLTTLAAHVQEAKELLENENATSTDAADLITELRSLIAEAGEGNKTVTGEAETGYGYDAQVTVTYDPVTGTIVSVSDNGTEPGGNSSFWNRLSNNTYAGNNFWEQFVGLTKEGVEELKTDPSGEKTDAVSGATYSSNGVKNAVLNAMKDIETPSQPGDSDMKTLSIGGKTYYYMVSSGTPTFTVDGQTVIPTQISGTDVWYYTADGLTGSLYGTATLTYAEFYTGDTSSAEYDAVSSATTSKNTMFDNEDSTEPVEGEGYSINGIKNVPVQVSSEQYVVAEILEAADALSGQSAGYTEAAAVVLNENAAETPAWYKTLNADGIYGAMVVTDAVEVNDATAELSTSSNWGDYQVAVTETSTSNLRNDRNSGWPVGENIMGIIVEATKDDQPIKVGLRHLENIWVQTYEFAFDADGVTAALEGATIDKITYIVPENVYEYSFEGGIYVKPQYEGEVMLNAAFSSDQRSVTVSGIPAGLDDVRVNVYLSAGHGQRTMLVTNAAPDETGTVALDAGAEAAPDTTYTVQISSSNYADLTTTVYAKDIRLDPPAVAGMELVEESFGDDYYRMSFSGLEEDALTAYLENDTLAVTVNGTPLTRVSTFWGDTQSFQVMDNESYGNPEYLAFTADCFPDGDSYEIVITAEGYRDLTYTYAPGGSAEPETVTVSGQAEVTGYGYTAQVSVVYDPATGQIVSVSDNGTEPGDNSSFWTKAIGIFNNLKGKTADTVDEVDVVSGATVSSNAIKEAVIDALNSD